MIDRYSVQEITKIWSLENMYKLWLQIELTHLKILKPDLDIPDIEIDVPSLLHYEIETKHDVAAFLKYLNSCFQPYPEIRRWLHFSLTSSDVKDLAYLHQIIDSLKHFLTLLNFLEESIDKRFEEFWIKKTKCIGRTHGIHAEPMQFCEKFQFFLSELYRIRDDIEQYLEDDLLHSGKFSGVLGNSIDKDHEDKVLKELGFKSRDFISFQIIPRDIFARLFLHFGLFGSVVERFATELRMLVMTEISEVQENFGEGQVGSSAMPHKKNPIALENICGLTRLLRGYIQPALESVILWHQRDLSHSSVERINTPDAFHIACYITQKLTTIINNLIVNEQNIERNLSMVDHSSQQKMNELIEQGKTRNEAYEQIKREINKTS